MNLNIEIPQEIRARYLSRRSKDISDLSEALKQESFAIFKRIGHQLKGNARSYNYQELENLAEELERAGETQDLALAAAAIQSFKDWYEKANH